MSSIFNSKGITIKTKTSQFLRTKQKVNVEVYLGNIINFDLREIFGKNQE